MEYQFVNLIDVIEGIGKFMYFWIHKEIDQFIGYPILTCQLMAMTGVP